MNIKATNTFPEYLVVNGPNLRQLCSVVGMFDGRLLIGYCSGGIEGSVSSSTLFWASNSLCYQHVVQPHQLGVRGILIIDVP